MAFKSPAKQVLIDFLNATKGKMNVSFTFIHHGNERECQDFVRRMRVELTRLRNKVRMDGRKPARFKVMVVSVKEITKSPASCEVILKKSDGGMKELLEYLDRDTIDALVEVGSYE